jgi:hypothetical protein
MRVIAAHADFFRVRFARGARGPRVLIAEHHVVVREVADRLHSRPTLGRIAEKLPRKIQHEVGFAVAAAEQKLQRLRRQVFDRMLARRRHDRIGLAGVFHHAFTEKARLARGCDDPAAHIPETVRVRRDRQRRVGVELVGNHDVRHARRMHVQRDDHRCRLRTLVDEFITNADVHDGSSSNVSPARAIFGPEERTERGRSLPRARRFTKIDPVARRAFAQVTFCLRP